MNIVTSELYENQLKEILKTLVKIDFNATKNFKIYLDTIIMNMPTKVKKYKKSIYFDNDNIKDIEFQGCRIPFLIDDINNRYYIIGITSKG